MKCFSVLDLTLTGSSHGEYVGAVLRGVPAGVRADVKLLSGLMARRSPGGYLRSPRRESDAVLFTSGVCDGVTNGGEITLRIENRDVRKDDYEKTAHIPRPSHADYGAFLKTGEIPSGGGRFSGRMTAPLCAAGAVALSYLREHGVFIGAHLLSVHGIRDAAFDAVNLTAEELLLPGTRDFPVIDVSAGEKMCSEIERLSREKNSAGGIIECAAIGLRAGLGGELWSGAESRLSALLFGIPAVKGVEFGSGFFGAERTGAENNDAFTVEKGRVVTEKNDHGGLLGGITSGMPLVFCAAVKPTPSIGQRQRSVDLITMEKTEIDISGRHDPCCALRAVPVIEAAAGLVLMDMMLEGV